MSRVLLVDDDVELCEMLSEYLQPEGFKVDSVNDGEAGAKKAIAGDYDIVVLDVMLPLLSGIEVLRAIRMNSRVPVLMLSARQDDVDRIVGLEMGADDYLPKPCNPRELVARLRAILRRTHASSVDTQRDKNSLESVHAGALIITPASRQAVYKDNILSLTSTEYNLLEALMKNAGKVVAKEYLSETVLGRRLAQYDRSIEMHISKLRRKIDPDNLDLPIKTIRGAGYQLVIESVG